MKNIKTFEGYMKNGWNPGDTVVYIGERKIVDRNEVMNIPIWLEPGKKCKIEKILPDEPYMVLKLETFYGYSTIRQLRTDFITLKKWEIKNTANKYNI